MKNLPAMIDEVSRGLAQAKTCFQVKKIRDRAAAIQRLTRGVKGLQKEHNRCGKLVVEAEARIGEERAREPKAKGGQPHQKSTRTKSVPVEPTNAELGLSKKESARVQAVAAIPAAKRAAIIAEIEASGGNVSPNTVLRAEKKSTKQQKNQDIASGRIMLPAGKFRCLVVDPPWPMQKIDRDVRPNQVEFDYPVMSEDELLSYDVVQQKAADDCHLWLWTTHRFLPLAIRMVDVWGFKYLCTFVWHKAGGFQPVGLPQYNCEFIVMARCGALDFSDTKNFKTCFGAERREHSRKPVEFYEMVRRVSPGPRLDMFSREAHDGFEQHGLEVKKFEDAL